MALSGITRQKRVKAARMLTGKDQKPLAVELEAMGLGLTDLGKWERNEPTAPRLGPAQARALSEATGVPPEWFLNEDLSVVFATELPAGLDLRAELDALHARIDQIETDQQELDDGTVLPQDSTNAEHSEAQAHGAANR